MDTKKKRIISFSIIGIILAVLIAGNIVASFFSGIITDVLCGTGISYVGTEVALAQAKSDELCQQLMEEGIVLLKNENNALPLDFPSGENAKMKINVLGWSATDAGFLLKGIGSGSSTIRDEAKVTLLGALTEAGFEYNTDIINMYTNFHNTRPLGGSAYNLVEPSISFYTSDLISGAKAFSDTAIVVFSRNGGENIGEIPAIQSKQSSSADTARTYLQTSSEEEELLTMASQNFSKVIVIINTANIMHLNFLDDNRVDAAFFVGLTGQSGTKAIAKVLKGEVNPSGKTSDVYTYSPEADPVWANREKAGNHIQYVEDIYYGYKWYETADAAKYLDNTNYFGGGGYEKFVQFPFGYGLSYTTFEWTVDEISIPSTLTADSKIEITMSVKNTGSVPGKDVIEVYYTPPYVSGGIEKAHVNLVAFAKTAELDAGLTQQNIKLSFSTYDMASYDCYDKNKNNFKGYELDPGDYQIKIMRDSHTVDTCENAVTAFNLRSSILFDKDPVTKAPIENRFTGGTAYAGVPIDGSTVNAEENYLSRADFAGTFPANHAVTPTGADISTGNNYRNTSYDQEAMPVFGAEYDLRLVRKADSEKDANGNFTNIENAAYNELNGSLPAGKKLVANEELLLKLADYNALEWEDLLSQLTKDEVRHLIGYGGFRTIALESVGKPRCYDFDGPAGFNTQIMGTSGDWTAFPSETLIGCTFNHELAFIMGLAMGEEASVTNVNGWYAPGVNLHRTAYNARNFEYYGEDGVHSGKMAAMVIMGAKTNGLYCYLKHFAISEPGQNPVGLNTWLTEQNFRENYLRPFEIAVKEGGSNAMMTAFNRIGAVWAGACYAMNVSILREEWGFKGSLITDYYQGEGNMNTPSGVRAGNDLWLNTSDNRASLSESNAVDMHCARIAAKNILYTYVDTYVYAMTVDLEGELAKYKAEVGIRTPAPVFPWWIPVLIVFDVAVVAGVGFWAFMILKPKKNKGATQAV